MSDPRDVLRRPGAEPDGVVRYGSHADALVDVHLPPTGRPAPLLVLLHGGFWRVEYDRRHTRSVAGALRDAGWLVATPEYRRTGGGGGWPATFDDVAALRTGLVGLLHGVLPGRLADPPVTLLGHSAGGHLALWWALGAAAGTVRRTVALAPVADLARAYADGLDGGAVADLLGGGPADHPDRYTVADVAARLRAGERSAGDLVVVHGANDAQVPVEHSRTLATDTGCRLVEPAGEHFGLVDPLSAQWPVVLAALGPKPASVHVERP